MTEIEFFKLVNNEIDWLRYYSLSDSRKLLNIDSDIYRDLKQMDYCKRVKKLDIRCARCLLSYNGEIKPGIKIEDLITSNFPRSSDRLTPLEMAFKIYPEMKMELINKLK